MWPATSALVIDHLRNELHKGSTLVASKEPPEISKAIEPEAWKATDPAGLKVAGIVERSQPARAAVDRGRWREAGVAGLASPSGFFPSPLPLDC